MRKKELNKFQFYRKITSEMVVCIDSISKALNDIPNILSSIRNRQTTIKVNRRKGNDDVKDIKLQLSRWEKQYEKTDELLRFR